jgi:hypothetical protein
MKLNRHLIRSIKNMDIMETKREQKNCSPKPGQF